MIGRKSALFLVSTPLHVFVACGIALTHRHRFESHLAFIDQPQGRDNRYLPCLRAWGGSPFQSLNLFYRVSVPPWQRGVRRLRSKFQQRRRTFAKLDRLVNALRPDVIFVGNDRRIEFQYAMHRAQRLDLHPTGAYMDEGTFTYVGRNASVSEAWVDNLLKRLAYGFWWHHPQTIGASPWVSEVYLAFPELAHPLLRQKHCIQVRADYFDHDALRELSEGLVKAFGIDRRHLEATRLVLTLPHESVMSQIDGYGRAIQELVASLAATGSNVAVKYHPRDSRRDSLRLGVFEGVTEIPAGIAFETLLPLLPPQCTVVGDLSSTLITTRWLRPDLRVIALLNNAPEAQRARFEPLFAALQVPIADEIGQLPRQV